MDNFLCYYGEIEVLLLVYTIDKNMKTFLNSDRFKIMKKAILLLLLFCIVPNAHSQVTLSDKQRDVSNFPVVTSALKAVVQREVESAINKTFNPMER